jgi:taurine dioxygenase
MVTTHPVTGRKVLFVNQAFTTAVEGMDDAEGQELLRKLFTIQQRPEFQVRLKWEVGTLTMWDDRCTQHYAIWDYFPARRHGHRVTVAGERPAR